MGAAGDTGTVITALSDSGKGNTITGVWSGSGTGPSINNLQQALVKGMLYITAETDKGSIRGQIEPASGTGFVAHLTGPQEGDSIKTNSSGIGSFLLTDAGLIYLITVRDINITAAHFHMAPPGVPGGIVKPITFNGHTAFGIWAQNDASDPLNMNMKKQLLVENLYVNVHSREYPNGEIRGQVLHAGGFGFSAQLMSSNRTGSDSTHRSASGILSGTLTDAGFVFHVNVNSRDSVTKAYFAGTGSGQSMRAVDSAAKNGTFSDVWLTNKSDDINSLTDQNITDLLKGNMSFVVVTAKDTLKGQLTPHKATNFTAMLTGPQEGLKVKSNASGVGHFVLTSTGLSYYITFQGIDTVKAAHFHLGDPGVPGGVVEPIKFDSNHVASGMWSTTGNSALSNSMINNLLEGRIYVNIHSPKYPEGEIRGQLVPASGTDFKAHLTGSQETPQVKNTTEGTGNFILTNEGLVYKITLDSLNITAAHFHRGAVGVPGGVVKAITPELKDSTGGVGGTAIGVWRRTGDSQNLTDSLLAALLAGDIYVNVHTSAHGGGEIRGQVVPNGGTGFVAVFDSSQNGIANINNVVGNGVFTLTDAGLLFSLSADVKNIDAASINMGQGGQGGSMLQDIKGNLTGSSAIGAWLMLNDTSSANNLSSLYNGALSVNLKTTSTGKNNFNAVISRTFPGFPTDVTENKLTPNKFSLEQNYPNPFNPNTQIKFAIPTRGMVNLSIYNILGEKVATLINTQMNTGNYTVSFNGSNLSSGIYFYRLIFENNITTKKMMLLK
jgi:hypothetical protein